MTASDPLRTFALVRHSLPMRPLTTFAFRDSSFSHDGETHVCVVEKRALSKFITVGELHRAFSGVVFYRRGLWTCYVGVWGRRNGKRMRRFLAERGATIVIEKSKPDRARLGLRSTMRWRMRVRELPLKVS